MSEDNNGHYDMELNSYARQSNEHVIAQPAPINGSALNEFSERPNEYPRRFEEPQRGLDEYQGKLNGNRPGRLAQWLSSYEHWQPEPDQHDSDSADVEQGAAGVGSDEDEPFQQARDGFRQELEPHHSQLIALGSAIGTGLFIGSGEGLAIAGPLPLLAAFCYVGLTLCPTVLALGEMATFLPEAGGFYYHTRMFVGEAWAATIGWNYAIGWLLTLPLELVAASVALQYWGNPLGHRSIWITIFLVTIACINFLGSVKWFARVEVVLSLVKVIAIVGFLILGLFIDSGLGFGGDAVGVRPWYDPGAGRNGFWGFASVLITAAFAYSGSELVGMTAHEQRNVRRDMPKAIKKVFWRIGIFYIASIFVIGILVPYNDSSLIPNRPTSTSAASPFVIAIKNAGIRSLPSIVNVVIVVTILSVANASVYGSSRTLQALAVAGMAPELFKFVDRKGRPLYGFWIALPFGFLAYLAELSNPSTVLNWLLAVGGLTSIFSWATICWTHICFRMALKRHDISVETLPFRSPLGFRGSQIGLWLNLFIVLIQFLTGIHPIGVEDMTTAARASAFFRSCLSFFILGLLYCYFRYRQEPGVRTDLGSDEVYQLLTSEVAWNLGDWINWARDNGRDTESKPLWWVWPEPLRRFLRSLTFPW